MGDGRPTNQVKAASLTTSKRAAFITRTVSPINCTELHFITNVTWLSNDLLQTDVLQVRQTELQLCLLKINLGPSQVAKLVECRPVHRKSWGFDPWSGHVWEQPIGVSQTMFLSLLLSQINKHMFLGED